MSNIQSEGNTTGDEIAVIGMSGRFPGAAGINEFWDNLKKGKHSISFLSDEEMKALEPTLVNNPDFVRVKGGILEDRDCFDASFFNYTPLEALVMDPQTRVFHECAWAALEDAGYDPGAYHGLIGLYAGASSSTYWELMVNLSGKSAELGGFDAGNLSSKDSLCTQVSYKLDLKGPSVAVQTACSTSLAAVHLGCQSLLEGECDMALAGGVTIFHQEPRGYVYQEGMLMSPDGFCRAFDAKARGIVAGSGAALVVLKPLAQALVEGDHIYAVVKGTAMNNDGLRKANYTAPSIDGQVEVIRTALQVADIDPESISYVEAHGTGTELGDPIEIEALKLAFNAGNKKFCAIGSVKTNIGHVDSAAGAAGFIKTILALKHRLIPPSLHFETSNPRIDFENSPFYVNITLKEWKTNGLPRRAGISSFGIGGTNVHVILEEALPTEPSTSTFNRKYQLILYSAKTSLALEKIRENLKAFLEKNKIINLPDAAYTLQTGRQAFSHRSMLVCKDMPEAINILSSPGQERISTNVTGKGRQSVVFMFSGQGSQYVHMARGIYQTEPLFRQEIDACIELLSPIMGCNIKEILYPGEDRSSEAAREKLNDVIYLGPVKFIVEYSLAKLLMKWGLQPQAMIGHSFGEYATACLAGVFSLEKALKLTAVRGKLFKKHPPGLMISVPLAEKELIKHLPPRLYLAAVNTDSHCIVSGPAAEVEHFENKMKETGYDCVRLNFDRAAHCPMMDPILEEFKQELAAVRFNEPQKPYISGITGTWIEAKQAVDPGYWCRHLQETIRFYEGIKELLKIENPIFVQPGSDRGLVSFVDKIQEGRTRRPVMNLVRHHKEKKADDYYLLNRIGELWHYGVSIDWQAFHAGENRHRISLPTYPFAKQRYWLDKPEQDQVGRSLAMMTKQLPGGKKPDIADWFYLPSWKQSMPWYPGSTNSSALEQVRWWVFTDEPATGVGAQLATELEKAGHYVVTVRQGQAFRKENPRAYTLDPLDPGGFHALVKAQTAGESIPSRIVHLWGVTGTVPDHGNLEADFLEKAQGPGFYSLLYILQALEKHQVSQDIQLTVITDHLQSVTGEEYLNPGKSTVMGLIRVVPQEYLNISCRSIDIALPPPGTASLKEMELIKPLLGELMAEPSDQEIAFRGGYKWTRSFEPIRLEETAGNAKGLKKQGVYLIVGGFGLVGTVLSGYLAGWYKAKLVLTGQKALPARSRWQDWVTRHGEADTVSQRIKKIEELEALGAEVMAFGADAANREQMRQVIDHTLKRFGRIDGVIFSVVLPDELVYKAVNDLDKPTCEQQFHAKVNGILVLEELLKDIDIDFCMIMSSISAVLGGLGFTGYSAANNFIDYWVLRHNKVSYPHWLSVDWDGWLPPGQSTGEKTTSSLGTSLIELSMTPEEGARAFERVLSGVGVHRLVQSTGDLQPRILRWTNPKPETREEETGSPTTEQGQKAPRRDLTSAYQPPTAPTEKALTDIWQTFFGYDKVGIHDDFFELGGDSLKALQMVSLIHKKLSARVPVKEFFAYTTAMELAQYIDGTKTSKHYSIEPTEKKEYYALSSAQKRLYFLQQMDLNSTAYNVPLVLPLAKNTIKNKLETALKELVARHDSLRTSFEKVKEEPVQRVYNIHELDFSLDTYEASGTGPEEIFNNFTRSFELSQAPLIRSAVVKLTTGHQAWLVDMHHIISDGTSCTILTEDFISLYNGEELAPLRIQYKEFAQWQNHLFASGAIKVQSDYWQDLYGDAEEIPGIQLPVDHKRPEVFTFAGDSMVFKLEPGDEAQFKQMSHRYTGTLYMNILALLNTLFYKYTSQTDIIIGTSIAGRPHLDLQSITGMFVNTLAMRNYPRGEKTYETLLKEVKKNSIKAFENQDVQFEDLVDKLKLERDPSRNPMFDICMVVQNFKKPGQENQGRENFERKRKKLITVEEENQIPIIYRSRTTKFDIAFFVEEQEKDIQFNIEYYTAIFKPDTIKRLVSHLKNIIRAVIKEPGIKIKDIKIMSQPEKRQVLFEFNDTAKPYPGNKTIHELFEQQVEQTPDNTALIGQTSDYERTGGVDPLPDLQFLTYNELNKKSNQLANYLGLGKQVPSDHCVGILMDRSIELIIAILGIIKAGAAYVPLDTAYPEERLKNIIDDAAARVIISRKSNIKTLNRLQWECPAFQTFLCLDSIDIYKEEEEEKSGLMDEKLWEYVAESAVDDITAGGWLTSTTGQPFTREEMDEYGDNALKKLKPLLNPGMRVLEIGCASGLTMYRIAPLVGFYYGTDLSRVIIEKNREKVKEQGHTNIKLACLPAHEINRLREKDFDLVIINSVIQSFHGHNYLRSVINKVLYLMAPQGYLFIGDVMDRDMKGQLIRYLEAFKQTHPYNNYITKTDWTQELFISREFFQDLTVDLPQIHDVEFSPKIFTKENELTLFRYDTLLKVDKNAARNQRLKPVEAKPKHKYQDDALILRQYPEGGPQTQGPPQGNGARQPAYVIYTSGTSGRPKGVLVEHRGVVRLVKDTNFLEWEQGHRLLPTGATSFDISTFEIWGPLLNRVSLVLVDNPVILNGEALEKVVQTYQVTHLHLTPQLFEQLAPGCPGIFQELHCFLVGGDRVRPQYVNEIRKKYSHLKILHMYGPTENTTFSTFFPVDREYKETLPIGRPIANSSVYILDPYRQLQPIGVYGELCTCGPGTTRGYLNNSELTAEKFNHDLWDYRDYHDEKSKIFKSFLRMFHRGQGGRFFPKTVPPGRRRQVTYKTGDLARWLPDGNIQLAGRIDSQVKIRGYRIETQEIEKIILTHPQVLDCIVEAKDIKQDKQLVAYYVPKNKIRLWPSLAEYFVYDDLLYNSMTRDEARNKKYRHAIGKVIKGKTVLEIGPGSEAILSRICIEEGAEKVYAVEILAEAYQKAKNLVKTMGLENRIILIHGDINEVELPEQLDYCVSEIVGSIGGSEGAAGIINTARGFLKNPAHMIPARGLTKIAAVTLPPSEFEASFEEVGAHYVEKVFRQVGYKFDLRLCLYSFPAKHVISTDDIFEDLDFTRKNPLEEEHDIYLEIRRTSILNGFIAWLNLYIDDEEVIDSLETKYIWLPIYLPVFSQGEPVEKGDYIRASVTRKISGSGVNPDFTIKGQLHKKNAPPVDFSYQSPHINKEFKSNPFYKEIFANIPLKAAKKVTANDIKEFLTAKLPGYMVPAYLVEIEEILITPNGKINRKELPEPGIGKTLDYTPPTTNIEKKLQEIWAGVLGIEKKQISINANFFALGGHSLKATILTTKIHKELQAKVPLAEVFKRQTIRGLAGYIKEAARAKYREIQPLEKKEYYQLSSAQKRLYSMHHVVPGSLDYNTTIILGLEGKTSKKKLETVLQKLIQRHEVLRTSFQMIAGEPSQRVHHQVEFQVVDYGRVPAAEEKKIIESFIQPFDITRAPLLRAGLLEKNRDQYVFMMDMHHIITDGTSVLIFEKEFLALYAGQTPSPPRIQYKDFSQWQNKLITSGKIKKQEDYWMKQLEGEVPILNFPTDFPRPPLRILEAEMFSFKIDKKLSMKIKKLVSETGATAYMLLLSVFNILLAQLTHQEDMVVGTPVAGRTHNDMQNIIGFFINMLVMRNRPKGDKTYMDFFLEVKKNALKAYENQDYQFEMLVEKVNFKKEPGRHTLVDAVIILQNLVETTTEPHVNAEGNNEKDKPGLVFTNYDEQEIPRTEYPFDLLVSGMEVKDEFHMGLAYSTVLFKPATAQKFIKIFLEILHQVLENREILLKDIKISTDFRPAKTKIPMDADFGF